ncbi:unnamed protein product [Paramecium pentaurelia]|uniref:Uncharacterized protein n=1 Tax=Paramecium pentaurelia TaxID=43138 RepID=A0A8S1TLV6_9CILI|nr:unnamed protein product [Paramecium pentaurelia]
MNDYNQLSNLKLIVRVITMGITCSSQRKSTSQVSFQNQNSNEQNGQSKNISQINENDQKLINNGISYFLRRIDQFNKQDQPHETKQLISFFEKQQQWLEWKLECDIAFIIDLTTKNDKKRIRLLKELLADKERHQSRFGIIYLGNDKAQFDLIDDSQETTYNLQKQLQNLKLDDWINIFKALRAHIIFNKEQILPSIYILSENQQSQNDDSILEVVDNLLEDTCQKHSLNFHCNSYKLEDKEFYSEQELKL